jgi:AraC-like DNA-binding protein
VLKPRQGQETLPRDPLCRPLPVVDVRSSGVAASRLGALLAAFGEEATRERPGRSLALDRLLELVLIEALRYRPSDIGDGRSGLPAGLAVPRIGNALRIMHADTRRSWTPAALAREAGMSRSAFASRFLQMVGVPPIEYLSAWRMRLAKSALASSDVPMIDIAEIAGYQSVSAFSTAFKRETGLSPTLYVRSLQKANQRLWEPAHSARDARFDPHPATWALIKPGFSRLRPT